MKRPGIDEHDAGSYLYGSLAAFRVVSRDDDGAIHADGAPLYDYEELNLAPDLCRAHSYELARRLGFEGPVQARVSYQPGLPPEFEEVLVKGDQIAAYDYGRACFEPFELRTAPCAVCGAETLISAGGYDDADS